MRRGNGNPDSKWSHGGWMSELRPDAVFPDFSNATALSLMPQHVWRFTPPTNAHKVVTLD